MSVGKKPKKWTECYPQGTKEGDEEQSFFIALARNPKYDWRSTSAIAKEAKLSLQRTEEIIKKYLKRGLVLASPKNEDLWAYWERVPDQLEDTPTLVQSDQKDRINKVTQSTSP